jgi:membrane associated rhomboid family serine protease
MAALEILSFFLQYFQLIHFSPNIANTAHIVGGLTGMLLGRWRLFAKR